ncbi:cysteine hydrolase [Marinivivus vitaminiproducens]|uniref:cysteine hydrolase n=1 Tax=Marinivivus vitaminiproducens TaxID=3035935 RepID=UPI0027A6D5FC|nr:cysteine hydrolase [Geminicoccaceae bacterium SCSIO 64248]
MSKVDPSSLLPHGSLSANTVHLCLDMQNLFADETIWHTPWMRSVLPVVERLARHRPDRTIFTRFIPPEQPEDAKGTWRRYYQHNENVTRSKISPRSLELVESLANLVPPATVIDKAVYSPFSEHQLSELLRARRVDTVIISGAETDVCVLATVLDAVDKGYRVLVAKDALCSSTDETHDALMSLYRNRFSQQIELVETSAVLQVWNV